MWQWKYVIHFFWLESVLSRCQENWEFSTQGTKSCLTPDHFFRLFTLIILSREFFSFKTFSTFVSCSRFVSFATSLHLEIPTKSFEYKEIIPFCFSCLKGKWKNKKTNKKETNRYLPTSFVFPTSFVLRALS